MSHSVHPVDERLPIPRLVPLAIQHVLVMYTGAVAVPLIHWACSEPSAGRWFQ
jgi:uric acid transporter